MVSPAITVEKILLVLAREADSRTNSYAPMNRGSVAPVGAVARRVPAS